ncbi:MAG: hypothetical protein LM559_04015 [Pyrobaculum sp.]|nr:hypothetical protein [Pyrobaculum sp.]
MGASCVDVAVIDATIWGRGTAAGVKTRLRLRLFLIGYAVSEEQAAAPERRVH